ncbi:xanthine dehydrogenase family protein [Streptomyces sp. NPDC051976]|uniref:xanthine dehydrogenase family protein molybdopterin-binding subunit n=1 Tax=Streptomyces sp. NPDC051976 TaxID=3154947 RepID=UPI0034428631
MPSSRGTAEKARGRRLFLNDMRFPGQLWAAVVRSPYPRARVTAFDSASLLRRPGVRAVFRAGDVPRTPFNSAAMPEDPRLPSARDMRLLTDEPNFAGDAVAVVVADSRAAARDAALTAPVTWAEEAAVLTLRDALRTGRRAGVVRLGDPRTLELLARCPVRVENAFSFAGASHGNLDPHACAARTAADGRVTLWTNTQNPIEIQRIVCEILGIPTGRLRVRKVDEGGGFGGKQEMYEEALACWLSLRLSRTVRLSYTRQEELGVARIRGEGRIRARLGFTEEGILVASHTSAVLNSGAYASHTPHVLSGVGGHLPAVYARAHHFYEGMAVTTNTVPAGAYRGYGVAEANHAIEQLMDQAAEKLGIDPLDLRRRNVAPPMAACLDAVAATPAHRPPSSRGELVGTGWSVAVKHSVTSLDPPDRSRCTLAMRPGGRLTLTTGTCDSGTGSSHALAVLAGAEIGADPESIDVLAGDTDRGADIGSTAQRSVFVGGLAARDAAAAFAGRVRADAAPLLSLPAESLRLRWPHVLHATTGKVLLSVPEAFPGGLSATASADAPDPGAAYAALRVVVGVDPESGQVAVHDAVMAVDCGQVVDRQGARGQVTGGIAQGIGLACVDRWTCGPDGRGPTGLLQHGVPRAGDVPAIRVVFQESARTAPSGIGELPIIPVTAAVGNAVRNAVGARSGATPLRPATVWPLLPGGADAADA